VRTKIRSGSLASTAAMYGGSLVPVPAMSSEFQVAPRLLDTINSPSPSADSPDT
jgi:hypothetical protein